MAGFQEPDINVAHSISTHILSTKTQPRGSPTAGETVKCNLIMTPEDQEAGLVNTQSLSYTRNFKNTS